MKKLFSRIVRKASYPKLVIGKNSGSVYLMTSLNAGTKLTIGHHDNGCPIGTHGTNWDDARMLDYHGTLELGYD